MLPNWALATCCAQLAALVGLNSVAADDLLELPGEGSVVVGSDTSIECTVWDVVICGVVTMKECSNSCRAVGLFVGSLHQT